MYHNGEHLANFHISICTNTIHLTPSGMFGTPSWWPSDTHLVSIWHHSGYLVTPFGNHLNNICPYGQSFDTTWDIWYLQLAIIWPLKCPFGQQTMSIWAIPFSIKEGRFGQLIIITLLLFHIVLLLLPRLHYHTTPTHLEVSLPLKPHSGARPSRRLSSPWLYLRDIVLSDFDHQSGFYDEYITTALLIGLYFGLYSLNLNKALYVLFSVLEKGR